MASSAAVIGLGRVGLVFATFLASKGLRIIGVESSADRREMISHGFVPSSEPNLRELFAKTRDLIEVKDLSSAVAATDFSFVTVPTPAAPNGGLSDEILAEVASEIAAAVNSKSRPHTMVVVCTVSPGTLHKYLPLASSKFRLCYSPVFVALGSVVHNLENPPFILIGADDTETSQAVASFYRQIGYEDSLIISTTITNAEIAKLTLNAFLATKIAFANFLGALCDRIPGADADEVLRIVGRDRRVGSDCFRTGTPFGGPCLPRDNDAFLRLSENGGLDPILLSAVKQSNIHWHSCLLNRIQAQLPPVGSVISIVGLSYKPQTDYTEDGFGLRLAEHLNDRGYRVIAYDPAFAKAPPSAKFEVTDALDQMLRESDVCILTWADEQVARSVAQLLGSVRLINIWDARTLNHTEKIHRTV